MQAKGLLIGALAAALTTITTCAIAQQVFPERPIRIIVGFKAGSAADVIARVVGDKLADVLHGSVVIENKPGASSDIGARYVASSAPDGYSLYVGTVSNSINFAARGEAAIDISSDLMPLAEIGEVPNILVVTPSLDAHSVADIIRLAKANPGQLSCANAGAGSALHMAAELLSVRANIQMLNVPYPGSSAAMPDLLSGRTKLMFAPVSTVLGFVRDGKLRAIAVTTQRRIATLPDVPTMADQGLADFESSIWFGIFAPKGLPPDIGKKLESAILASAGSSEVSAKLAAQGIVSVTKGSSEFTKYIKAENGKWAEVIKERGLKL
jgi:tripartite-type tricarboxylate transporter receptor subunit TctC